MRTPSTVRILSVVVLTTLVLAAALTACGTAPTVITVTITSHADGERILGARGITLAGTLAGGPTTAFEVTLNGTPVGAATHTATAFSAPLTLDDGANTVTVAATSDAGTATRTLTLTYPFLSLSDFAPATTVIGQPDFTTTTPTLTASGVNGAYGSPALANGVFYAPDYGQDRVLGFLGGIPTTNGAAADFVLGQPDATAGVQGTAADEMDGPQTVATTDGKLLVVEYKNSRVLVWNSLPTTSQAPADVVVGQPGFGTSAGACSATGLLYPESIFTFGGKLLIADSSNNRVLIYNTLPTTNGAAANFVLGQADFTHCIQNDDNQDGAADGSPTARTLNYPTDVWTDGTRLIVADYENNRVLIWNTFPTTDFQPADVVIGQSGMTTDAAAAGADGMKAPYFLDSNGNQLFVTDNDNNRLLIFDTVPTTNGAGADHVLGQSDFTHVAVNDDNQDDVPDATPTARTLHGPAGVSVTDDALVVGDADNNRLLVFRP